MAPYITAVDYLGQDPRFEVVYNLYATKANERIRLWVKVSEQDCELPTVTGVWRGADWFERYCYDMYGIRSRVTRIRAGSSCTRSSSVTRSARTTRCAAASR